MAPRAYMGTTWEPGTVGPGTWEGDRDRDQGRVRDRGWDQDWDWGWHGDWDQDQDWEHYFLGAALSLCRRLYNFHIPKKEYFLEEIA